MKKTTIIAIIAGVVALALIATGVYFIVKPAAVPTAKAGEEISIPIKLKSNPGFAAADLTIEYDVDNLTFVNVDAGKKFDVDSTTTENGKIRCVMTAAGELKDTKEEGELLQLKFKVKDSAEAGEYTIKVGNDSKFANVDEKWVECKFEESKFEIVKE